MSNKDKGFNDWFEYFYSEIRAIVKSIKILKELPLDQSLEIEIDAEEVARLRLELISDINKFSNSEISKLFSALDAYGTAQSSLKNAIRMRENIYLIHKGLGNHSKPQL